MLLQCHRGEHCLVCLDLATDLASVRSRKLRLELRIQEMRSNIV